MCRMLGIGALHEHSGRLAESAARLEAAAPSALKTLLQLLFVGKAVRQAEAARAIPSTGLDILKSFGILRAHPRRPKHVVSPVVVYPLEGLYIASDRWKTIDGSPTAKDYVFPAIHPLTHGFLNLLPRDPCDKFLDLCSGTAIAALIAAKSYARHAWAVDITPRAARFGEFNCRLNAVENVTVMLGNLYEPVRGMKFDRVAVHPPYVPSLKRRPIYADGGQDGESITRAIVRGLPRHFAPGGRFYSVNTGVEREGEPYEQRVRKWLGTRKSEFDIVYIEERTQGPLQFAYRTTQQAKGSWDDMDKWVEHFRKLRVKNLCFGLMMIQSRTTERWSFTVRRKRAENGGMAEAEWLRNWETAWAEPTRREHLMASRVTATKGTEIHVVHSRENSRMAPSRFTLTCKHPFAVEYECPAWVAKLVERCDGMSTPLEQFETGKREDWIPADTSATGFAGTLGELISRGILAIEGFEPPPPMPQSA
jgi:SAM-dependent methyltransferase